MVFTYDYQAKTTRESGDEFPGPLLYPTRDRVSLDILAQSQGGPGNPSNAGAEASASSRPGTIMTQSSSSNRGVQPGGAAPAPPPGGFYAPWTPAPAAARFTLVSYYYPVRDFASWGILASFSCRKFPIAPNPPVPSPRRQAQARPTLNRRRSRMLSRPEAAIIFLPASLNAGSVAQEKNTASPGISLRRLRRPKWLPALLQECSCRQR